MPTTIPNLAVYDFEGQLENAFACALRAGGYIPEVDTQGGSAVMQTPRIEGKLVTAEVNETHRVTIGTNQYATRWDGVLYVKVVTERSTGAGFSFGQSLKAREKHRLTVAATRWTALYPAEHLQPYLKLHSLVYIREIGTNPTIEADKNWDLSALTFRIVIAILPSALPQP